MSFGSMEQRAVSVRFGWGVMDGISPLDTQARRSPNYARNQACRIPDTALHHPPIHVSRLPLLLCQIEPDLDGLHTPLPPERLIGRHVAQAPPLPCRAARE